MPKTMAIAEISMEKRVVFIALLLNLTLTFPTTSIDPITRPRTTATHARSMLQSYEKISKHARHSGIYTNKKAVAM